MKEYWLAKLIESVDAINSRKRLQKIFYLLQFKKDFPLKLDYILHYYGPYSFELASLLDQLRLSKIICETPPDACILGASYSYTITPEGSQILKSFEKSKDGEIASTQIQPFINFFGNLAEQDIWLLELAATAAYFYQGPHDWHEARKLTGSFKKVSVDDNILGKAVDLATQYPS
jgi:uncharacterized protein YwgA